MKFNDPTFSFPTTSNHGSPQAVNTLEYDKQPREKKNKRITKPKKSGASLGWGWFQGFNLFITIFFLVGFLVFAYFMVGGENRHNGVPKYVLDVTNDTGQVMFNPQIPAEIRKSYEYIPPIKNEIETAKVAEAVKAKELARKENQITLLSAEEAIDSDSLGSITLVSSSDGETDATHDLEFRIQDLVEQAEVAMSVGDFVGTENHDAYHFYEQVLELDSNNDQALKGISQISDIYYQHAERAFYEGNFQSAEQYLSIGLIVNPNNTELNQLQGELNQILYPEL